MLMTPNDLNYHHLLYFWAVAKEGSLRRASEVLHVSQPSISAQLKQLEESLGAPLFTRTTRRLILTDTGQTVLEYAEEIFSLGGELLTAVRQEPGERPLRLHVGVADSVPKIIVRQHLTPVFELGRLVRVICREGSLEELITQLAGAQAGCRPGRRTVHERFTRKNIQPTRQHLGCRDLRRSAPCPAPNQAFSALLRRRTGNTPCRRDGPASPARTLVRIAPCSTSSCRRG